MNKTIEFDTLFRGRLAERPQEDIKNIHFKGDFAALANGKRPRVAVIGTRDPSPYGIAMTESIVEALSRNPQKPIILSGLALGIDTAAHRAALEHGLGTVAVLPTGLDTVYPYRNTGLAETIMETKDCCLVTQFPEQTAPMAMNFLIRNTTLALLSDLVIVVESKEKGGAMVTAKYAWDAGIPVLAVPGRIDDTRSAGCNALINLGQAKMLFNPEWLASMQFDIQNEKF